MPPSPNQKLGVGHLKVQLIEEIKDLLFKAAEADMRYFARSKSSRSFVHKKKFGLICLANFELEHFFVKGGRKHLLNLNEICRRSRTEIVRGNFVNKP